MNYASGKKSPRLNEAMNYQAMWPCGLSDGARQERARALLFASNLSDPKDNNKSIDHGTKGKLNIFLSYGGIKKYRSPHEVNESLL